MAPRRNTTRIPKDYASNPQNCSRIDGLAVSLKHQYRSNPAAAISAGTIIYQFNRYGVQNNSLLDSILSMCQCARSEYARTRRINANLRYALMMLDQEANVVPREDVLENIKTEESFPHMKAIFDEVKAKETGGSKETVELIRTVIKKHMPTINADANKVKNWNGFDCSICRNSFADGEEMLRHGGACSAMFHSECMHALIAHTKKSSWLFVCPFCSGKYNSYTKCYYSKQEAARATNFENSKSVESSSISDQSKPPQCEKCDIEMVEKQNRFGGYFWGCPNYVRAEYPCNYTRNGGAKNLVPESELSS